ncbi:MAG: elongation factor G [Armatimonadetes bacterium]|nr:elongation factor G [Armatimonadota bacterium]
MKPYEPDKIRNVALISHGGAGKTSLAEAMLFDAGAVTRMGRVEEGNAVTDYDEDEIRRQISVSAALAPLEWKGVKINVIDTPGFADFQADVRSALRVVEGVVALVDAVAGVEVGTELYWRLAQQNGAARVVFVNKMRRENANVEAVVESIRTRFGKAAVPVQVPVGGELSFRGVVDVITKKAMTWDGGKEPTVGAVPADLADQVEAYRAGLIEVLADVDEELGDKFLMEEEITNDEILRVLRQGVKEGKVFPILFGAASDNIAVQPLMDLIAETIPSPADRGAVEGKHPESGAPERRDPSTNAPFSAYVFKSTADPYVGKLNFFRVWSGMLRADSTVYDATRRHDERIGQILIMRGKHQEPVPQVNAGDIAAVAKLQEVRTGDSLCDKSKPIEFTPVEYPEPLMFYAISPKTKGDEDKMGAGLSRLVDSDPSFRSYRDPVTKETIIAGMGDQHLAVVVDRLQRMGVAVETREPRVPYREIIRKEVTSEYKHKKQTGGRGQYGHVVLRLAPASGEGFKFDDEIVGGVVPKQYIPAVQKGVEEALADGVLAGYPVTDVEVVLTFGSYHTVDSSELAFKIAGSQAFKEGVLKASPSVQEPIYDVEITVPEEHMGDVISDLNTKRGRVQGMDQIAPGTQVIRAQVPLGELHRYSIDLRSFTRGRATYTMKFAHYEEAPASVVQQIVEEAKKAKEEERK